LAQEQLCGIVYISTFFTMKFSISDPSTGKVKVIDEESDRVIQPFMDKRMGAEMDGGILSEELKGYVLRISGGNDKQGFPMMQGILSNQRVRLLFSKGMKTFRERRKGSRKRKSVRGAITNHDLAVMQLTVTKKGDADVVGLNDETAARRLGPKRASKIRKLFGLTKDDDVRKYVVRREREGKTPKAPKIQRLITPQRMQRKRHIRNSKVRKVQEHRDDQKAHAARKIQWFVEQREKRAAEAAKKKGVDVVAKKK